ncbi:MAG TPA: DUF2127 domain-containing protein [Bryobacteraceae bacterium]|nr:DUF2127 domain-containing protein [Bryobacteraceae bacterium]
MGTVETRPQPHHPPPQAIDTHASLAGLRAVATFEALKGLAVLLLGIALLFVHKDAETFADSLLFHLHISIDRRFAQSFLNAASKLSDARLWTIAAATFSYCTVRFVESWGLWHRRVWAEWFALLSGALYLPLEVLKLAQRTDWERVTVLAVNIVIILYMLYIRIRDCRWPANCDEKAEKVERFRGE